MESFQLVYEEDLEEIIEGIKDLKNFFKMKKIEAGISESINKSTHFIKISFPDEKLSRKNLNMFNIYIANILYKALIEEFSRKYIIEFITDTYFFLDGDEIDEVKKRSIEILNNDSHIIEDSNIYYMNRKNEIIEKIVECIEENKEINIKGFLTFRMKELKNELQNIIDKIVEDYLIEKEYNEFIKLLKYFVDIQDSKIDEVNIIIDKGGNYIIQDGSGDDLMDRLFNEFLGNKFTGTVNMEDMLISGLITYCPNKIIIHCANNCHNTEFINTIKNVFLQRVEFCDKCKICNKIKEKNHN
ncbi:YtxC-like family protein [Clostridium liquoris]|uniref:YtxC-like family protein n=1 Tax=Clostridium liquoris TaxID=1289519 RepID=A0A2T0B011_9CLOT|nr:putative sporulation protein YtxC [Clostridium liquoris]PRR76841.1 YtxC-like family protein [Clostridium liquoris]